MLQSLPLLSLLLTLYEGFNIDPFCSLSRHHPGQPMQRLSAAEDGVFFCRREAIGDLQMILLLLASII